MQIGTAGLGGYKIESGEREAGKIGAEACFGRENRW